MAKQSLARTKSRPNPISARTLWIGGGIVAALGVATFFYVRSQQQQADADFAKSRAVDTLIYREISFTVSFDTATQLYTAKDRAADGRSGGVFSVSAPTKNAVIAQAHAQIDSGLGG